MTGAETMLRVEGLDVLGAGATLVRGMELALTAGERVALIGESGCGKSLSALALLGLLPEGLTASGSIRLVGVEHDLVGAGERQMSAIRGRRIAMVFQEPMTALNPTMRIGRQVAEAFRIHGRVRGRRAAQAAAIELLERVRLPEPGRIAGAYPHELSGGQRQRVVLAIALSNRPAVLVCDEPTTALDVTVQAQMLGLITDSVTETNAALLFITHDLAVAATACRRVLVMYGGRVVEAGPVRVVLSRPRHPYTLGLVAASDLEPLASRPGRRTRLTTIAGTVPAFGDRATGCAFRTRCPSASSVCETDPAWSQTGDRGVACWHPVRAASDD